MPRTDFRDLRVWLTGASTGIGRACALEFLRRGARVAVSARNEEKLNELVREAPEGRCLALPFDVTDKEANLKAAAQLRAAMGGIDMVFLNAGTWKAMDLKDFSSELFENTMRVNFTGMVYSLEAALPLLYESPRPHLVGMSSSVAYRGIPRAEAYCASKAAIRAMLQGLRAQLHQHNIPVSIVMPGFVRTPLTDTNDFAMPFIVEPEAAARRIANGIQRHKHEIAFPLPFITILKAMAMLPSSVYTRIMARRVAPK